MTNTEKLSTMWRIEENDEAVAFLSDYGLVEELLHNDNLSRRAFDKNGQEWVLAATGRLVKA